MESKETIESPSTSAECAPLALPYQPDCIAEEADAQRDRYEAYFKLDSLGPMIINTDGTIQRVSNWHELTKEEQDKTFRLICARNQKRIEALKREEEEKSQELDRPEL